MLLVLSIVLMLIGLSGVFLYGKKTIGSDGKATYGRYLITAGIGSLFAIGLLGLLLYVIPQQTTEEFLSEFNRHDPVIAYQKNGTVRIETNVLVFDKEPIIRKVKLIDWRARARLVGKEKKFLYWRIESGRNSGCLVIVKYI